VAGEAGSGGEWIKLSGELPKLSPVLA